MAADMVHSAVETSSKGSDESSPSPLRQKLQTLQTMGQWFLTVTSNVGTVVILLVLGHFLIEGAFWVKGVATGAVSYDARVDLPIYDAMEDKILFGQEMQDVIRFREFKPHVMWQTPPFRGQFINVSEEGVRKTVAVVPVHPQAKQVFLFGGSTMWGEGAPDAGTIPSQLQQLLGPEFNVTNYGEIGYTSVQEYNRLLALLTAGNVPDMVIFYDGANDAYTSLYSPGEPRSVHNIERMLDTHIQRTSLGTAFLDLFQKSNYPKVLQKILPKPNTTPNMTQWDEDRAAQLGSNVRKTLNNYDALMVQTQALADTYGFEIIHVWHPYLFSGSRQLHPYEQDIVKGQSPVLVKGMEQLYRAAKKRYFGRERDNILFFGDVFNQVEQPVYIDWTHVGVQGNHIVAQNLARHLQGLSVSGDWMN